ncbi:MAG: PQQ-binding-like beta-propeller repeat protein [Planctomycetes bacterium]|nr:PQQ-binding-like beta-propeller repeat protein [Planctomycetota bacterium]
MSLTKPERDEIFARIAVLKGHASFDQVEEGRRIQKKMESLGLRKSLAEVMVYREFLPETKRREIRHLRRFFVQRRRDRALADAARAAGILDDELAAKGFELQRAHFSRTGDALPLLDFLLASGGLSPDAGKRAAALPVELPRFSPEEVADLPDLDEAALPEVDRDKEREEPEELEPELSPSPEPPPARRRPIDPALPPVRLVAEMREEPAAPAAPPPSVSVDAALEAPPPAIQATPVRLPPRPKVDPAERHRRVLVAALSIATVSGVALVVFLAATASQAVVDSDWKDAEDAFEVESYDDAERLFRDFLEDYPGDSRAKRARERLQKIELLRGERAFEDGDLARALESFERAGAIDPSGPHALESRRRASEVRAAQVLAEKRARMASLLETARALEREKGVRVALDFVRRIDRTEFPAELLAPADDLESRLQDALAAEILASFVFEAASGADPVPEGPPLDARSFAGEGITALPLRDDAPAPLIEGVEGILFAQTKGILYALDAATGTVRWTLHPGLGRHFPLEFVQATADGFPAGSSGPTDLVLVSGARNSVARISLPSGQVSWEKVVPEPVSTGALAHEGRLYLGSFSGRIHVYEFADGRRIGSYRLGGPVLARPAVDPRARVLYAACGDSHVYACSLSEPRFLSRFEVPYLAPSSPVPLPPWVAVFGSGAGGSRALFLRPQIVEGAWNLVEAADFSFEGAFVGEPAAAPARLLVATDRGEAGVIETSPASGRDGEVFSLTQRGQWLETGFRGPQHLAWLGPDEFLVSGREVAAFGIVKEGEKAYERLPRRRKSPPETSSLLEGAPDARPFSIGPALFLQVRSPDGDSLRVLALDRETFEVRWRRDLGAAAASGVVATEDGHLLVRTTQGTIHGIHVSPGESEERPHYCPVFQDWGSAGGPDFAYDPRDGGTVYFADALHGLRAIDVVTGWEREDWAPALRPTGGLSGPPALSGKTVYFATTTGHLHGLDATTGAPDPRDEFILEEIDEARRRFGGGPAVSGNTLLIGTETGELLRIDRVTRDGGEAELRRMWGFPCGAPIRSTPVVAGGLAWFGAEDRRLRAVGIEDDREAGSWEFPASVRLVAAAGATRVAAASEDGTLAAFDVAALTELWRNRLPARPGGPPILSGSFLWIGDRSGNVYRIDPGTGERVATWILPAPVAGTPAIVGGRLYVPAEDGMLYRIEIP